MQGIKSGWKTTEFWGSAAAGVAVFLSALQGSLPPKYAALAGTLIAGLYALSRGLAKLNGKGFDAAVREAVALLEKQANATLTVKAVSSPPAAPPPAPVGP